MSGVKKAQRLHSRYVWVTKFWIDANGEGRKSNVVYLSHPSILGVTLCFCTGSYAAAAAAAAAAGSAAGRRFLFTR